MSLEKVKVKESAEGEAVNDVRKSVLGNLGETSKKDSSFTKILPDHEIMIENGDMSVTGSVIPGKMEDNPTFIGTVGANGRKDEPTWLGAVDEDGVIIPESDDLEADPIDVGDSTFLGTVGEDGGEDDATFLGTVVAEDKGKGVLKKMSRFFTGK